jgi:hypothetical protein
MRRVFAKSLLVASVAAMATPSLAASGDPYALSDAILIDFTFTAPDGVTPKYFGGDVEDCLFIGDADCVLKDDQVNFGTMAKPDGYVYSIRHEYAVEASAPPPDFSEAFFELTSFFTFSSVNDDNVTLSINWTVTYNLFTEGNFSQAGIAIDYSTKGPDNQGIPDTPLFAPISVANGGTSANELDGVINLQLFPGDTQLRIEDPVTAAAAVPEPAAWAAMLIGFACVGLAARSRRNLAGDIPA